MAQAPIKGSAGMSAVAKPKLMPKANGQWVHAWVWLPNAAIVVKPPPPKQRLPSENYDVDEAGSLFFRGMPFFW